MPSGVSLHSVLTSSSLLGDVATMHTDVYGQDTVTASSTYPEASPVHPSYPAGHPTVAGAGITLLKAVYASDTL